MGRIKLQNRFHTLGRTVPGRIRLIGVLKGLRGGPSVLEPWLPLSGWRFDGMLCEAEDLDTGAMWECPLLIQLNRVPTVSRQASTDTMEALGQAFHNLSAFGEETQADSAKSPDAAAANDPKDSSKVYWSILGGVLYQQSRPQAFI